MNCDSRGTINKGVDDLAGETVSSDKPGKNVNVAKNEATLRKGEAEMQRGAGALDQ